MSLFSFSGERPLNLGITGGTLSPCPSSPNCVCSDSTDSDHAIPPFRLTTPIKSEAWDTIVATVANLPRTTIVTHTQDYLHAECHSALLGFVDDLELHLRPEQGEIGVRSASRLGHSDWGVNRKRVEALRSSLITQGIVQKES